ncbi:MAG: hypothetical protein A2219_08750 [Elusimicrobia bacterium RIFOXYA2_FULL_50_26]|nr:MAG: hypothetical protein A2219_08750 [Elusimicrobia bacterium RIFOXYA2_FULL_50_26]
MALDLSGLHRAVNSLERAVKTASSMIGKVVDSDQDEVVRAGVIQNFEFTYEMCWKFIRRWLEINGEGALVDGATRKEIFRIAAERRLIDNPQDWFDYTKARNETAHTYNPAIAEEVYDKALLFLDVAKRLVVALEARND